MTTRPLRGLDSATLNEAEVAAWLETTPDFFDRHPQLLARLRLTDPRGSAQTVSLVERQAELLRDRNRELSRKLDDFVAVARDNDALHLKVLALARRLAAARSRAAVVAAIEAALREDFGVSQSVLVLAGADEAAGDSRFLRSVRPEMPELRSFETLFTAGRPRCGQLRDSQREFLFGPGSAEEVGSVALVPLGAQGQLGLLACASPDADRFNPTMSTDFLARIGELIAVALTAG